MGLYVSHLKRADISGQIKRIGVIHLNQIGDLVFSLPLLKALRENYPEAAIHSIARPYLRELLEGSPWIDHFAERRSGIKNVRGLLGEIRRQRYDLMISLSNSVEALFLTCGSRARLKVGFSHFPWDFCLHLKDRVDGHPAWSNNLKLLKRLNLEVRKNDYVGLLALPPRNGNGPEAVLPSAPAGYAVFSAGTSARRQMKAWSEEKFAELMLRIHKRYDFRIVLVGGKGDQGSVERILSILRRKSDPSFAGFTNLAGRVGLRDLCYVLKDARLFVGVDSGIMHLASSLDIPVVGLFGPSDPSYVGPQNARSASVRESLECVPCYFRRCATRDCMSLLKVEKVFEACERVLAM
jgi:ADP-heptose:LPS heptosyltransferase